MAAAAAGTTGSSTVASVVAAERDRNALASHFQERDRLILQHQQQQLQQQQQKKEQLQRLEQEREKCLNNNDRIHDYVTGTAIAVAADRERTNALRGSKSPGKLNEFNFLYSLSKWGRTVRIHKSKNSFFDIFVWCLVR